MKKIIILLIIVTLAMSSSFAFASKDESLYIVSDAFVLRPLGFVATVTGTVLYLVSWPIAAVSDSSDKTFNALVKRPFDYTFKRPIGEKASPL